MQVNGGSGVTRRARVMVGSSRVGNGGRLNRASAQQSAGLFFRASLSSGGRHNSRWCLGSDNLVVALNRYKQANVLCGSRIAEEDTVEGGKRWYGMVR